MSAHARIAPSSLARIVACPGSLALIESVPALPPTEETLEGDAGHWVAAQYAAGNRLSIGTKTPQGLDVDADMIAGAELWAKHVGTDGVSEMPVTIERIHATDCWGTPDSWQFTAPLLRVSDYKYGFGYVEVFENWQLIAYTIGLLDMLCAQGYADTDVRIDLAIVQPRSYHRNGPVRHWRKPDGQLMRGSDLRALCNVAMMAAAEALKPNAPTRAGTHCLHCDARHVCETLRYAASHAVEFVGKATPTALHSVALGTELQILHSVQTLLKARLSGLEQQAESALRAGAHVPGFAMESGQSRLKWKLPVDQVVAIFEAQDMNVCKPLDVITPTQAKDRFKIDDAVMGLYADRPPGAMKLSKSSTTDARKVFNT